MKFDHSSEFMKNQKHAIVMSPALQFEVLQTGQGESLFFSIGTDGVFYCTREVQESVHGWLKTDLSSALSAQFPGGAITAKAFDVAQDASTGLIDVALTVTVGGADHLVIAFGNSDTVDAWASAPAWQVIAYDDPDHPGLAPTIAELYLARPGPTPSLVVDVVLSDGPIPDIARYFIDPGKSVSGVAWVAHPLPVDLEAGTIASAIGRKANQQVDGIYTLGTIVGTAELIYSPLYNPFDPSVPPSPSRFNLPPGAVSGETPFALAANPDGTTNVFLAASGALHFLASDAQADGATPTRICAHPLLAGVKRLHVDTGSRDVLVWGLDAQGTVFCLRNAPGSELTRPWTTPIPLVLGVDQVATLLNARAGNRVIFAQTSDETLVRLTEDPVTSLWARHDILLPPTRLSDVVEHSTYTTHVQVYQDDNLAAPDRAVAISATSRCNVYINNRYLTLTDTTPVSVNSDAQGTITIVQDVANLNAACYKLQIGELTETVNPMAIALARLATVSSGTDLDVNVTDEQGRQQPLVGAGVSDQQKADTAQAIRKFVQISSTMPADGSVKPQPPGAPSTRLAFDPDRHLIFGVDFTPAGAGYFEGAGAAHAVGLTFVDGCLALRDTDGVANPFDVISASAGDVFNWMENALDDVEHFFVTVVDGVTNFFVKIAGQMCHFVMDCVNDVVRGIEFVLQKIAVFIDVLIMWLGFIFGWGDIIRTHRVLKNLLKRYAEHNVNQLGSVKAVLQEAFAEVKQEIDSWAALPAVVDSIGSLSRSSTPLPGQNSPQANWGLHHFKTNAENAASAYVPSGDNEGVQHVLDELVTALEAEGGTLLDAVETLKSEVIDKLAELSATQIIKKVVAIVMDVLIDTAERVVVVVVDIIAILITGVTDLLDASLDIPVLSWIYKLVVGEELSFLDLVCLVAAIPMTLIHKLAKGSAAFPDDDFTAALIGAPDFSTIQRLYARPSRWPGSAFEVATVNPNALDDLAYGCNIAALVGAVALSAANVWKFKSPDSGMAACLAGICYLPYVAPDIPQAVKKTDVTWYDKMNTGVAVVSIAKALVDVSLYRKDGNWATWNKGWRMVSPAAECFINLLWQVPTTAAYCDSGRQTTDVMNLVSGTTFNLGGVLMPGTVYPEDKKVQAAFLGATVVCSIVYGGLQLAIDLTPDSPEGARQSLHPEKALVQCPS